MAVVQTPAPVTDLKGTGQLNASATAAADRVVSVLAAAGVKSFNASHTNASPKMAEAAINTLLPRVTAGSLPISPLGIKGKPMNLAANFSGIGGDGVNPSAGMTPSGQGGGVQR